MAVGTNTWLAIMHLHTVVANLIRINHDLAHLPLVVAFGLHFLVPHKPVAAEWYKNKSVLPNLQLVKGFQLGAVQQWIFIMVCYVFALASRHKELIVLYIISDF